jgi:hypothetical protein
MKHGVKPTREQRKMLLKWGLDPAVWFVIKDKPHEMWLVHRHSDKTTRILQKGNYHDF